MPHQSCRLSLQRYSILSWFRVAGPCAGYLDRPGQADGQPLHQVQPARWGPRAVTAHKNTEPGALSSDTVQHSAAQHSAAPCMPSLHLPHGVEDDHCITRHPPADVAAPLTGSTHVLCCIHAVALGSQRRTQCSACHACLTQCYGSPLCMLYTALWCRACGCGRDSDRQGHHDRHWLRTLCAPRHPH